LFDGWLRVPLYAKDPWRQIIITMIIAAVFMGGFPMDAFAKTSAYRPVFYYYHADRLGSSSVMTDWEGDVVQHYGYTAFGKERYVQEADAFKVTSRYTGQKLDEDTGLYYYGARYYDPELGRFIQPDSVVPTANTSQSLNRYAYVVNNPLKYDDPTGHGNFFKEFIGTIITVALCLALGGPWYYMLAYAAIGSGVSTLVNGGTFASFAIGMGISVAAMGIASPFGDSIGAFAKGFGGLKDIIGYALKGVLQGAISGAISSAVYGQNVWKGMGQGAIGGAIGAGVALGAAAAMGGGVQVLKEVTSSQTNSPRAGFPPGAMGRIMEFMAVCMVAIASPSPQKQWSLGLWATFAKIWVAEMNDPGTLYTVNGTQQMAVPPGFSNTDEMVKEASRMGSSEWREAVSNYGMWDFKRIDPRWENFGNFAFGVTGSAQGFTSGMLQRAAGIFAGVGADKCLANPKEYGKMPWTWMVPCGKPPYCDDRIDQFFIRAGAEHYNYTYNRN
jgi:RHS repeat-associated protein